MLMVAALFIVSASLYYTNILANSIAKQEKYKVELLAYAYRILNQADENTDIGLFEVIKNNENIPVILTDEDGNIKTSRNLDSSSIANRPNYLLEQLEEMKNSHEPIVINTPNNTKNFIYYKDSFQLVQLRYYPYVQITIIVLFFLVAYIAFSNARTAEQNRVWAGMAKETAHQLGTPTSSLAAWVEYIKEMEPTRHGLNELSNELQKDVDRLELVAERFSKIGSSPRLEMGNVHWHLEKAIDYIKRRSSKQVNFSIDADETATAMINPALFDWVIENLLKNALDAMDGKGDIHLSLFKTADEVIIDVNDSGKGMPSSTFSKVFQPGFSTKKRGWGLGLALSKRIIEQYHNGKIFVKQSEIGKGTTFRVILNAR